MCQLVQQLKEEALEAHRVAKEMDEKYRNTAEELDMTRAKLESAWLRNQQLDMELKTGARGNAPITKQMSSKKLAASMASIPNGKAAPESEDESEYTDETETETETGEWSFLVLLCTRIFFFSLTLHKVMSEVFVITKKS